MARKKRSLTGWLFRLTFYAVFLVLLGAGVASAAYYSGLRLPIWSDLTSFVLKNWNQTRDVAFDADYDSSVVRKDDRMHFAVDLRLPETVERLRAYMDGGRTLLVDCGRQKLFLHQLQSANLTVEGPVIGITGKVDLELDGLLQLREGRNVAASIRTGHDRTTVWAQVESLSIEGLPDPMVRPLLQKLARVSYTREQVLNMAADSLSPELATLLKTHRDALDLGFEKVTPSIQGGTLALDAEFSIDERAVFSMVRERFADTAVAKTRRLASLLGPQPAQAQGLGDLLKDLGKEAEKALGKEVGQILQGDPEDLLQNLAGLADCKTAF